mmetsp:Transcript_18795/g.57886  ORF Transcript_18795/g.57886 Transcript_18795/m.57886 type:complete len:227 (+) Transcript_18795:143-823(+)
MCRQPVPIPGVAFPRVNGWETPQVCIRWLLHRRFNALIRIVGLRLSELIVSLDGFGTRGHRILDGFVYKTRYAVVFATIRPMKIFNPPADDDDAVRDMRTVSISRAHLVVNDVQLAAVKTSLFPRPVEVSATHRRFVTAKIPVQFCIITIAGHVVNSVVVVRLNIAPHEIHVKPFVNVRKLNDIRVQIINLKMFVAWRQGDKRASTGNFHQGVQLVIVVFASAERI